MLTSSRSLSFYRSCFPLNAVHSNTRRPPRTPAFSTCLRTAPVMPAAQGDDDVTAAPATSDPQLHTPHANHAGGLNHAVGADAYHAIKNDIEPTQALPEQCARVHRRVCELLAREARTERMREVQRQTRISLGVIGEALGRWSLDELSFSYNGGKDCLVLLILYLAALHTHHTGQQLPGCSSSITNNRVDHSNAQAPTPPSSNPASLPNELRSVYIVSPNPFPAVTSFVASSSAKYHLSLARYHQPMKEAFASYLADYPQVRAIFVGTRRTDPHGGTLTFFDPTDGGWPSFMRIHPVIDWHYADIWTFIREVGVEYCELYDMGYTSLGGTDDTWPNPALEMKGGVGDEVRYRPAFELIEDDAERLGRDRS